MGDDGEGVNGAPRTGVQNLDPGRAIERRHRAKARADLGNMLARKGIAAEKVAVVVMEVIAEKDDPPRTDLIGEIERDIARATWRPVAAAGELVGLERGIAQMHPPP